MQVYHSALQALYVKRGVNDTSFLVHMAIGNDSSNDPTVIAGAPASLWLSITVPAEAQVGTRVGFRQTTLGTSPLHAFPNFLAATVACDFACGRVGVK